MWLSECKPCSENFQEAQKLLKEGDTSKLAKWLTDRRKNPSKEEHHPDCPWGKV